MSGSTWLHALFVAAVTAIVPACKKNADTQAPDPAGAAAEEELILPERPFDYHVKTLENGMQVITLEDHSAPIAAVQVWYHVGSKDERPDRRGFAHMFEHMMFRGTQNIGPKAHFEYIRKVGGDANAYTSFDNTTYIQVVPSNQVEMVLWLEAERMGFLKINEGYFDTERKVVAEEYRLRREQPYGTALEKLLEGIFEKHPYRWSPIGDMDELAAASADELQTFWNTYYVPNNAALVVVGDVKHEEVEKLAETYFGWIPKYPDPPRVTIKEPQPTNKRVIEIEERNGPVPISGLVFRTVAMKDEDALALEMLAQILGGGESSRLYRDLVDERELAMVALSVAFHLEDDGFFVAGGVMSPLGDETEKVLAAVREHIERIKKEGVTEDEITKARNNFLRNAVTAQLEVQSKAQVLGEAAVLKKDLESVNRRFKEIRDIGRDDIQRVAQKYLLPEREIEVRIKPNLLGFIIDQFKDKKEKKEESNGGAEEISGEGEGKPGLVRPASMPTTPVVAEPEAPDVSIDKAVKVLDNGLKVVSIQNDELPFVTYVLGMDYGAYADPADRPGLASVVVPMLTRGTENYDYKALTDELDRYAVSIGGSVSMDALQVRASAVVHQADRAMRLLAETVRRPTFPEKELDKYIKQLRTGLMITERSPDFQANRELKRRIFGDHPYGRLADVQLRDLGKMEAPALAQWWGTYTRPDASVLYVAGNVTSERAFELAQKYFGDWKAEGPRPEVPIVDVPAPAKTKIYLVDRAGEQSQIRVGHAGITRKHPDFVVAKVLSDVFGGGFNSRLNDTIRVKKGLTYGAGGGFSADRFAGTFIVSTFSKNSTVAETVRTILSEIERLKKEAPSEQEERDSKSYLLGSFGRSWETPQDLIGALWSLEYQGLPEDYYEKYVTQLAEVKSADVVRVAKELVDEKHLVIVVVGPAKVLEKDLRKIAEVEVVKDAAAAPPKG